MFRSHPMLGASALCLVSALLLAACGGDKSTEETATGGRVNSGGAATGGSTPSSGGSGGAGGSGGVAGAFACDPLPPPGPEITANIDAAGNWGTAAFKGGSFVYGDADMDKANDIKIDYSAKNMHITGKVGTYTGFGIWFGPVMGQTIPCIDGSAYKGVSFEMSDAKGTVESINFQIQTHGTAPVDAKNMRGGCVWTTSMYTECLFPTASVSVPASGGAIETTWDKFMGGKPLPTVDPKGLDGLQWQFPWTEGGEAYEVDVTVSNVKFF
jgi:hypothetical protein